MYHFKIKQWFSKLSLKDYVFKRIFFKEIEYLPLRLTLISKYDQFLRARCFLKLIIELQCADLFCNVNSFSSCCWKLYNPTNKKNNGCIPKRNTMYFKQEKLRKTHPNWFFSFANSQKLPILRLCNVYLIFADLSIYKCRILLTAVEKMHKRNKLCVDQVSFFQA